jgi:hypothetical protein
VRQLAVVDERGRVPLLHSETAFAARRYFDAWEEPWEHESERTFPVPPSPTSTSLKVGTSAFAAMATVVVGRGVV